MDTKPITITFDIAPGVVKEIGLKNLADQIKFYSDNVAALEEIKKELSYGRYLIDELLYRAYQRNQGLDRRVSCES